MATGINGEMGPKSGNQAGSNIVPLTDISY
jgi:hypothetical protein